eukprot:1306084-Rhodomonas_salina.1
MHACGRGGALHTLSLHTQVARTHGVLAYGAWRAYGLWRMAYGARSLRGPCTEIRVWQSCNFTSAVCTPEGKTTFAVGSDKKIKEIAGQPTPAAPFFFLFPFLSPRPLLCISTAWLLCAGVLSYLHVLLFFVIRRGASWYGMRGTVIAYSAPGCAVLRQRMALRDARYCCSV